MTVCLELLFPFCSFLSSPLHHDCSPLSLVIALSWTTLWYQGWDKMPCRLCPSSSPYLLHALPLSLLYHLCVHQYLLMHDLYASFIPTSPHCYPMYHHTIGAHFLSLLHVYYHAPYACLSSISTGQCSALYCRLDFLSNQVAFLLLARECCLWISLLNHFAFPW